MSNSQAKEKKQIHRICLAKFFFLQSFPQSKPNNSYATAIKKKPLCFPNQHDVHLKTAQCYDYNTPIPRRSEWEREEVEEKRLHKANFLGLPRKDGRWVLGQSKCYFLTQEQRLFLAINISVARIWIFYEHHTIMREYRNTFFCQNKRSTCFNKTLSTEFVIRYLTKEFCVAEKALHSSFSVKMRNLSSQLLALAHLFSPEGRRKERRTGVRRFQPSGLGGISPPFSLLKVAGAKSTQVSTARTRVQTRDLSPKEEGKKKQQA